MTLTDEELARLEARTPHHDGLCGANPMLDDGPCGCYEQLIDRLLSTLREERDEVKRLRGTLERIIDEASDPAPDLYTITMAIRLARAALSQPSKEGTG